LAAAPRSLTRVPQPGYVSHEVSRDAPVGGQAEYTVTQSWASKAEYEAWFNTPFRRRSHFPAGVWQARCSATAPRAHALTPPRNSSTSRPTSSPCQRSSAPTCGARQSSEQTVRCMCAV